MLAIRLLVLCCHTDDYVGLSKQILEGRAIILPTYQKSHRTKVDLGTNVL